MVMRKAFGVRPSDVEIELLIHTHPIQSMIDLYSAAARVALLCAAEADG